MITAQVNRTLDRVPRPSIKLAGRPRPSFQVLGISGFLAAIGVTQSLAGAHWVMLVITAAAAATFFAVAIAVKMTLGEEKLVYYHHEIAVLLVAAGLTALLGWPVLTYLDLTAIGIGTFLVFGRLGCLLVGCCHGRPHRWGVRYGDRFAEVGFDRRLVGARLLPTQLIESACVLGIVCTAVVMVARGEPAGMAFAWYIVAYDLVRFFIEFVRGDTGRPYAGGFSQAQWVSTVLTVLVAGAELLGGLPRQNWHLAAAVVLVATMVAVAARRRLSKAPLRNVFDAGHVHELAAALRKLDAERTRQNGEIQIAHTSAGLSLSSGCVPPNLYYSMSGDRGIDRRSAKALAYLIQQLRHPDAPALVTPGTTGTYHVLFTMK